MLVAERIWKRAKRDNGRGCKECLLRMHSARSREIELQCPDSWQSARHWNAKRTENLATLQALGRRAGRCNLITAHLVAMVVAGLDRVATGAEIK